MSCAYNFNDYIPPRPPREWSRVQNSCSLVNDACDNEFVRLPYSNKIVPSALLSYNLQMLAKGNILQYKANSGNLTKAQRYSKIARGQWTNRNTTWASQSTNGITNPNTSSLKRVGTYNIALDPITGQVLGPTLLPVTCPQPIDNVYPSIPPTVQSSTSEPPVPPPPPPAPPSGPTVPPVPQLPDPAPVVIQDSGSMVCSIQENICTGETKVYKANQLCNLTTDSDVPGRIEPLCWNDGTPTWYPRQRYTMSNSTNKWPINAKLRANKVTDSVNLTNNTITNIRYQPINNGVNLIWDDANIISLNRYKIIVTDEYENIIKTLYTYINYSKITSLTICNVYNFSISIVDKNNVEVTNSTSYNNIKILWPGTPSNVSITDISGNSAILNWTLPVTNTCCNNLITEYNIYINNVLIDTVSPTTYSYNFTNLINGYSYNLGVSTVSSINDYTCTSIIINKTLMLQPIEKSSFYYNNEYIDLTSLTNTSVIQNISIPSGLTGNNVLVNISILFDYVVTTHSIQMWGFSLVNTLDQSVLYFECLSDTTDKLTTVNNGYMHTGSISWCDNVIGLKKDANYELYIYFDNNDDTNITITNISFQLLPSSL
jgi:hypothetical protein